MRSLFTAARGRATFRSSWLSPPTATFRSSRIAGGPARAAVAVAAVVAAAVAAAVGAEARGRFAWRVLRLSCSSIV